MKPCNRILVSTLALTAGLAVCQTSEAAIVASFLGAESDIVNTGGTLVSAANFGEEAVTVNGIAHGAGTAGGTGLTINTSFEGDFRNGASGLPTDGSNKIQILLSGIAGTVSPTMSVAGLTVGTEYLFQMYWEAWAGEVIDVTIEGATLENLTDFGGDNAADPDGGTLISYQFTATDNTLNASMVRDNTSTVGGNLWFSGYSLQVVPEPSSLALLGLGGLMIARRRRG